MSITITPDQVNSIVWNQHQDPFQILGPHPIEENGKVTSWVVRAYLPNAEAVWVVLPEVRKEYSFPSGFTGDMCMSPVKPI